MMKECEKQQPTEKMPEGLESCQTSTLHDLLELIEFLCADKLEAEDDAS